MKYSTKHHITVLSPRNIPRIWVIVYKVIKMLKTSRLTSEPCKKGILTQLHCSTVLLLHNKSTVDMKQ